MRNHEDVNESGSVTDYNTNNLNQYTKVADVNYAYDENGNFTKDGSTINSYDCENRLMVSNPPIMLYRYDYAGRRVRMQRIGPGMFTIKYCYDGDQVIAEYDGGNNLLRKFVYGPGIDEPICMIDVADGNTVYYYHFDGLGSVRAVSDANAAVVEKYSYDVFGGPTIRDANDQILTASDCSNPYMFTGRRYDPESGLYYYRARYYSPEIGRFLQVDPLGYAEGLNLYSYVGNNPVKYIDPFGESWWDPGSITDEESCLAYCKAVRNEHLATAKWAYHLALTLAKIVRDKCLAACEDLFPPGGCPEDDPLDSNEACKALCWASYGSMTTAAYVEYGATLGAIWAQYGACCAFCSAVW